MPIQRLADEVISKIAAGEVVERPASVVKELLENSLDAGATNVHIEVDGGGRTRIRISDDGSGILADEVELALVRHATSKIRTAEDLSTINTLGFRGEALASIAAVSRTAISTRHRDEDVGTQVRVEGGRIVHQKPMGAPAGTVITIENLFYNTPARLKFMKSESTEKRHVQSVITQYAMAYPDVRFVYVQDGREVFRSPGTGELGDVVVKVMGLDAYKEMIEAVSEERIRETGEMIDVFGYVSLPSLHRKDRTRIIIFVNGRAVQDSGLTYAVTQAYHTLIEKGRHPFAVLMIRVPTHFVDVNVHPTKAEVRFQDTNLVFTAVQRAVRRAVIGNVQTEHHPAHRSPSDVDDRRNGWSLPYDKDRQMDMDFELGDERHPANADVEYDDEGLANIPVGMGQPEKPRTLPPLRVVGQVGAAYIVAEGPAGMYLIDQYAAHSRVLYQELKDLYEQQERIPHRPLNAQTMDVSAADAKILEKHLETLNELGFVLEPFGTTTFILRGVPNSLQSGDATDIVYSLIDLLKEKSQAPLHERLLIRIAERAAVKAGQILNMDDTRNLLRKLERCPEPRTSPGGQTTFIHMSADDLTRQFGRR